VCPKRFKLVKITLFLDLLDKLWAIANILQTHLHPGITMNKQNGMTMTGFLLVAIVVGFLALTVIKITPAYMEFRSVKQAMDAAVSQASGANDATVADIKESLGKRLSMNYVSSIASKDIKVVPAGKGFKASVEYQAEKPYVANVFLVVKFKYETETK
jgi:Tfp pilus assembly major pilin PilA